MDDSAGVKRSVHPAISARRTLRNATPGFRTSTWLGTEELASLTRHHVALTRGGGRCGLHFPSSPLLQSWTRSVTEAAKAI